MILMIYIGKYIRNGEFNRNKEDEKKIEKNRDVKIRARRIIKGIDRIDEFE